MTTETTPSRPPLTAEENRKRRESAAGLFVKRLEALIPTEDGKGGDRAALAALRRGLGKQPGDDLKVLPYVVRMMPSQTTRREESPYYLTASLFALYPVAWTGQEDRSLGASLRLLALDGTDARGAREDDEGATSGDGLNKAVERRFTALLNADDEGSLATHLRHAVSLLKSKDASIDWRRLLIDIGRWNGAERPVQRRWAQDFWSPRGKARETPPRAADNNEAGVRL